MHRWICLGARSKCRASALTANMGFGGVASTQGTGAAKAKVPRTEVVWRNPRAVEMTR